MYMSFNATFPFTNKLKIANETICQKEIFKFQEVSFLHKIIREIWRNERKKCINFVTIIVFFYTSEGNTFLLFLANSLRIVTVTAVWLAKIGDYCWIYRKFDEIWIVWNKIEDFKLTNKLDNYFNYSWSTGNHFLCNETKRSM